MIGDGGYLINPARGVAATIGEFVARLKTLARDRELLETRWRAVLADPAPERERTMAEMTAAIAR